MCKYICIGERDICVENFARARVVRVGPHRVYLLYREGVVGVNPRVTSTYLVLRVNPNPVVLD